jgi:putative transposase
MPRPSLQIRLSSKDRQQLQDHLSGGVQPVRSVLRALALFQMADGVSASQIARFVPLTAQAIRKVAHRFEQGGLDRALFDKSRPGAAALLDAAQQQRIIAMVCSEPPTGRSRWTVRLVAEEAVKRRLVPRVGREAIRVMLLSHDLKPWREKNVVRSGTE